MDDDTFTHSIALHPHDDDLRRVYADWLATQEGDPRAVPRAAFLRWLVDGKPVPGPLRTLLHHNDARWLARMDRTRIATCPDGERPDCPRRWELLDTTEEDGLVRYCSTCRERVFYCTSADEARQHGLLRRCVALALTSTTAEPYKPPGPGRPGPAGVPRDEPAPWAGLKRQTDSEDDAVWYSGTYAGLPVAVTFRHAGRCGRVMGYEELADRMRFVVPLHADADVDLWPQWRVPDDPGFSFTGTNLGLFDVRARHALTRFTTQVGAVTVRHRGKLRLPSALFADATLVLVHWTAIPCDEGGMERELRWRIPELRDLAAALDSALRPDQADASRRS